MDASRDLRALRANAERHGVTVAYAADTHLHADLLTGALRLAAADRAHVLASSAGNRERALAGASMPHRAGRRDVRVLNGGPQDWADVTGTALESDQ